MNDKSYLEMWLDFLAFLVGVAGSIWTIFFFQKAISASGEGASNLFSAAMISVAIVAGAISVLCIAASKILNAQQLSHYDGNQQLTLER